LAAFNLINTCDQLSSPRGCRPANIAILVPLLVFAQAFKLATDPPPPGVPFFHGSLPAPQQVNGVPFCLFQIGINSHRLSHGSANPSFRDVQDTLITHVAVAEVRVSSLYRADLVDRRRFASGSGFDRERWRLAP